MRQPNTYNYPIGPAYITAQPLVYTEIGLHLCILRDRRPQDSARFAIAAVAQQQARHIARHVHRTTEEKAARILRFVHHLVVSVIIGTAQYELLFDSLGQCWIPDNT